MSNVKTGDLSLSHKIYIVEQENTIPQVILWPLHMPEEMGAPIYTDMHADIYTHTLNEVS